MTTLAPTAETVFTPKERTTLTALAEALFPRLPADGSNPLYPLGAGDLNVPAQLIETLAGLPNQDEIAQLKLFLRMIETGAANAGIAGIPKPFSRMNAAEQDKFLVRLGTHRLNTLRGAFRGLKGLAGALYFAGVDEQGRNPTWEALGYPGPLGQPPAKPKPIQPLAIDQAQTLTCDVVVIGSGAGGGVVAGVLAQAGKDVVVLEKGGYYNEADFNQYELEAYQKLYLDRGLTASADKSISLLAGSCLGGGTIVNWTTSFPTPERVRQEWDDQNGWEVFYTGQYERSSQAVLKRMHVTGEESRRGQHDEILWRGLEGLNWQRGGMTRNVQGCTQGDDCGFCMFGCPHGAKQSTMLTYLQDAHERGTRIVVNCNVERVTTEQGRASGVIATAHNPATGEKHNLVVRAKAVVLAAGALNTPAILLRSGLGGPAVGKYLHLHPATALVGYMKEQTRPWAGTMQAAYSQQFSDLDGQGYGAILETGPAHMAVTPNALGWAGGRAFKDLMARGRHSASIVVITRDRDTGSITVNRQGLPIINYNVSRYDAAHARIAVAAAARLLLEAGATELCSLTSTPQFYRAGGSETIEDYMSRLDRQGWGPNQTAFFSYHQMSSARMGSNPQTSVVNEYNECHTTPGLYVADGSAFPGASGVNPMISIETIAHRAASLLASKL